MQKLLLLSCAALAFTGSNADASSPANSDSSNCDFREDWRETPAQIPVTQEHDSNDQLLITRHGPSADMIKKSHHDEIPNDPWYVWSGMCREGRWAISLRKMNALVDLREVGQIRWRVRQSGPNVLKVILELEDGTWLVSDRGFGETPDWHVFTLNLVQLRKNGAGIKWHKLDIDTIEAGQRVAKPDLSRVRSIGWTDLMVGKVSKGCTRVDWIEVVDEIRFDISAKFHRNVFAIDNQPTFELRSGVQIEADV